MSRWAPFANKRTLPALAEREGIRYVFLGDSLGGKPEDPTQYDAKGKPDYRKIRAARFFQDGLDELVKLSENTRTSIMCAEEDPSKCHRLLLIGPALEGRGIGLMHIRKHSSVQRSQSPA